MGGYPCHLSLPPSGPRAAAHPDPTQPAGEGYAYEAWTPDKGRAAQGSAVTGRFLGKFTEERTPVQSNSAKAPFHVESADSRFLDG